MHGNRIPSCTGNWKRHPHNAIITEMLRKGKSQYGFWERWKLENFQTKSSWRLWLSECSKSFLRFWSLPERCHRWNPRVWILRDPVRRYDQYLGTNDLANAVAIHARRSEKCKAANMILFESFLISIFPWIHIDPFPLRSISVTNFHLSQKRQELYLELSNGKCSKMGQLLWKTWRF